ncbi:hypothetical protein [Lonepinella sp. MS14435]|uniref:hypothetical protein n=1 Tax=Lonepinella sp. MS14435 TaxID=3003618 RepID=UPI0036DBFA08
MRPDKRPDRLERIGIQLLINPHGISELELAINQHITSGRNEVNKIEKLIDVKFARNWENTADGMGQYYRYSVPNRATAEKLLKFVESKAVLRGEEPYTQAFKEIWLDPFPYAGEMAFSE